MEANAKKLQELKQYQELLDNNKRLADKSLQEKLELENPRASDYIDTLYYERFVANLDLSVKDIFLEQLNYIKPGMSINSLIVNLPCWPGCTTITQIFGLQNMLHALLTLPLELGPIQHSFLLQFSPLPP